MIVRRHPYDVKVGITASLTGRYSHPGSQALTGVQAWAGDTNLSGGVRLKEEGPPVPVRLVYYDDASSPQRCAELTEALVVKDRVDILLGPYSSGLSLQAAVVAARYCRVLWNHGGALEAVNDQGAGWAISILTPARMYFHGTIDMLLGTRVPALRVAIVSSTAGGFPREVASGAEAYCREHNITSRAFYYGAGTSDFGPILGQLEEESWDLILGVGRIEDDVQFAQQLARSRVATAQIGLIATPLTLFREALGDATARFLGPSQWEEGIIPAPDYGPSSEAVMRSLTTRRPSGVDYPMAQAYAGCLVAQRCVEAAGSLDNDALRQEAGQLNFTTFYGRFAVDPLTGRQLGHVMPVVRWEGSRRVVVWPLDMATTRRGPAA